jgi:hypothetical protein
MTVLVGTKKWTKAKPTKRFRRPGELNPEEQACARVALGVLRVRHGSLAKVAKAMGIQEKTAVRAASERWNVSAAMALEIARLAGVTLDDVISGRFPEAGACPMCGRKGE